MLDESALMSVPQHELLTAEPEAPFPRRELGKGTLTLMILLRVYVFLAIPIVAFAFIRALLQPQ